jgi:hypothetical protein
VEKVEESHCGFITSHHRVVDVFNCKGLTESFSRMGMSGGAILGIYYPMTVFNATDSAGRLAGLLLGPERRLLRPEPPTYDTAPNPRTEFVTSTAIKGLFAACSTIKKPGEIEFL